MGNLIDSITYPFISPNLSWGRVTDGQPLWTHFFHPTPMQPNLTTSAEDRSEETGKAILYPNPVTRQAMFRIPVERPGRVRLEIINALGAVVSVKEVHHEGDQNCLFRWDPEDGSGSRLRSGIYLYRITTGPRAFSGKFLVQ
jgi:hypothetical protein